MIRVNKIEQELKKYKDIEQELGCPLEVLFKLLKAKKIYCTEAYLQESLGKETFGKMQPLYKGSLIHNFCNSFTYNFPNEFIYAMCIPTLNRYASYAHYFVRLKDYKITWWLSETKEE